MHTTPKQISNPPAASPGSNNFFRIGPSTQHLGLRAAHRDVPSWIKNYTANMLLEPFQIFHLGVVTADPVYCVARECSPVSHFIVCLEGEGQLWSDGQTQPLMPGHCCFLPKGSTYMDHTVGSRPWKFCYVCYSDTNARDGFHGINKPLVELCDPSAMRTLIQTFIDECQSHTDLECQRQLLSLIHHLVIRETPHCCKDQQRLEALWQSVADQPAADWSLTRLENASHLQREHLRRLTQRLHGRSPVRQVVFIRMKHAAHLLHTTNLTLEHIAAKVGYGDAFSFSVAFKNVFKINPSAYRHTRSS